MKKINRSRRTFLTSIVGLLLVSPLANAKNLGELLQLQTANVENILDINDETAAFKLGTDLARLAIEYNEFITGPGAGSFSSANTALTLRDELVLVDFVASDDPERLEAALRSSGVQNISRYQRIISGYLPISTISRLSRMQSLHFARPGYMAAGAGLTTSQGDAAMETDSFRAFTGRTGSGVTVGTLSDTYNALSGAAGDVLSGDLPGGVTVISDLPSGSDEGRAMMQIVHDVAPDSSQGFHTAFGGQADFALGIEELAGCPTGSTSGCTPVAGFAADIINDDVFYFAEPFFQDGVIAQAVDFVVDSGVTYFALAGNHARKSYEADFEPSGDFEPRFGGELHDFDPGPGVDAFQSITVPVGAQVILSFQWDQPYFAVSGPPGADSDLDIFIYDTAGNVLAEGANNNTGADPVELLFFFNDGIIDVDGIPGPDTEFDLGVSVFSGTDQVFFKYIALVNGALANFTVNEYDTGSSTIYGHMNAEKAITVGAAPYFNTPEFGVDPAVREPFTSAGPTPIIYDTSGNISFSLREKPDLVAPDGGNTTFFGFDIEPDGFPNFFGTSAATPHAAGLGALVLDGAPNLLPIGLKQLMQGAAAENDMAITGFDFDTGHGFLTSLNFAASTFDNVFVFGQCGISTYTLKGTPNSGFQTFRANNLIYWDEGVYSQLHGEAPVHVFRNGFIGDNGATWADCNPEILSDTNSGSS